jgi:hypothetical protein
MKTCGALQSIACLTAAAIPLSAPAQDVVFRRGGGITSGKIAAVDPAGVKVEVFLVENQPPAILSLPRGDIDRVDFAENEKLSQVLKTAALEQLPNVERFWAARSSWIDMPESLAGEAGLVLGDLMLASEDAARHRKALDVFKEVESKDWSPERRARARQGRLRALVKVGRATEALAEAAHLAQSAEDPEVLLEAKLVLAEGAAKALRDLVSENPRWEQDDEVRPEHYRLYQEAIDLFLFPYLFHGSDSAAASRGLWGAVELYRFTARPDLAEATARDIVALYPNSSQAPLAKRFLADRESTRQAPGGKNPEEAAPNS